MNARPPAEIGTHLEDVETPALLIDLDAFERNLCRLADQAQRMGVRVATACQNPQIRRYCILPWCLVP